MTVNAKALLAKPLTRDYVPSYYNSYWLGMNRAPRFTINIIEHMLTDPRINFGLRLIKGPVMAKARFYLDMPDGEPREFIKTQLSRFWRSNAMDALRAIEWGYSFSEVLYQVYGGKIQYSGLRNIHAIDCRCLTNDGTIVGGRVKGLPGKNTQANTRHLDVLIPKGFWHVHDRQHHPFYGRSRLYGCYLPYLEKWSDGGFRDSRRLFFHKYAYSGYGIYHPPGSYRDQETGELVVFKDLARDIVEKMKTGAAVVLPNATDDKGQRMWEIAPVEVPTTPTGLLEYGEDLDQDLLEGMGIPPEVAQAEGTGAYAGRRVPMDAYYCALQEVTNWLAHDFNCQVIRPLVELNFGPGIEYEIIPFGLATPSQSIAQAETQGSIQPQGSNRMSKGADMSLLHADANDESIVVDLPPRGYRPKYTKFSGRKPRHAKKAKV